MHIIVICAGILYLAAGIWSFAYPGAPFNTIAFPLGMTMLIGGLCGIAFYIARRKRNNHYLWKLAEGTQTAMLAAIVLSNIIISESMVLLFFSLWAQFSAILSGGETLALRKEGKESWLWILPVAVLLAALGITGLVNPFLAGLRFSVLIGSIYIIRGIGYIISGVFDKWHPTIRRRKVNEAEERDSNE